MYVKHVRLGVGAPTNFTPGPYMIGAMVPRQDNLGVKFKKMSFSSYIYKKMSTVQIIEVR